MEDNILKLNELGLTNLPTNLPYSSYIKDNKGIYQQCNSSQLKLYGMKKVNDLLGLTDFDLCFKQHEASKLRQNDNQTLISKTKCLFIEEGTCIDGKIVQGISIKIPYLSASKKIIGITGVSFIMEPQKDIFIDSIAFEKNKKNALLTRIQADCLYYLTKGMTYKQIGETMGLSWRTVSHYIDAIKFKLHCEKKSDLIQKALALDFIKNRLLNS